MVLKRPQKIKHKMCHLTAFQQGVDIAFQEAGYQTLGLGSHREVRQKGCRVPNPSSELGLVSFTSLSMTLLTSLPPLGERKHLAHSRRSLTSASTLPK